MPYNAESNIIENYYIIVTFVVAVESIIVIFEFESNDNLVKKSESVEEADAFDNMSNNAESNIVKRNFFIVTLIIVTFVMFETNLVDNMFNEEAQFYKITWKKLSSDSNNKVAISENEIEIAEFNEINEV